MTAISETLDRLGILPTDVASTKGSITDTGAHARERRRLLQALARCLDDANGATEQDEATLDDARALLAEILR